MIAQSFFKTLFTTLMMLFLTGTLQAQDNNRFNIKLNDSNIQGLKSNGSIRAEVPSANRGKLSAIVLGTYSNQDKESINMPGMIKFTGDAAIIELSDSNIEQMQSQPVRFETSGNSFAQIFINYRDDGMDSDDLAFDSPAEPSTPPVRLFYVNLTNNKSMQGEMAIDELKMDCKFGSVSVPIDLIAGIRFHVDGEDSAVVVLTNGDSITGKPVAETINMKTEWGTADVSPASLSSMTTNKNATFAQENTDFGPRWQLRTAIPIESMRNQLYRGR